MRRALIMCLIVGNLVGVLNHGDKIFSGIMTSSDWIRYGLTFLIPYAVSTLSSLLAIREHEALSNKDSNRRNLTNSSVTGGK